MYFKGEIMTNKLKQYNGEIQELFRASAQKKELIDDFKKTDQKYLDAMVKVKEAQDAAKEILEQFENAGEWISEKKALDKSIKEAIIAATEGSEWEDKEKRKIYTEYCKKRSAQKVGEVITKGVEFTALDNIIDN